MRITLSARSKMLQLAEQSGTFRIQATGSLQAGSHVDLIPNSEARAGDVTITHTPLVVVDFNTSLLLADKVVDFDYNTDEFIISNRGHE